MGNKTVVKLTTEVFKRGDKFCLLKSLRVVKRKSIGFDILNESISENLFEDMQSIEGLCDLADGEYELTYSNIYQDYETSFWEYDGYKLISLQKLD